MQQTGAFGALVQFDVFAMQDDRDIGLAGELIALHAGSQYQPEHRRRSTTRFFDRALESRNAQILLAVADVGQRFTQ